MEPLASASQRAAAQPAAPRASRDDIRRAIHRILRRLLLQHLAQWAAGGGARPSPSRDELRRALIQSYLLEDILYKRADTVYDYQDPRTLEERVRKAGRALFLSSQRMGFERESERRLAAATAAASAVQDGDGDAHRRRIAAQCLRRAEGGRPVRRMSF